MSKKRNLVPREPTAINSTYLKHFVNYKDIAKQNEFLKAYHFLNQLMMGGMKDRTQDEFDDSLIGADLKMAMAESDAAKEMLAHESLPGLDKNNAAPEVIDSGVESGIIAESANQDKNWRTWIAGFVEITNRLLKDINRIHASVMKGPKADEAKYIRSIANLHAWEYFQQFQFDPNSVKLIEVPEWLDVVLDLVDLFYLEIDRVCKLLYGNDPDEMILVRFGKSDDCVEMDFQGLDPSDCVRKLARCFTKLNKINTCIVSLLRKSKVISNMDMIKIIDDLYRDLNHFGGLGDYEIAALWVLSKNPQLKLDKLIQIIEMTFDIRGCFITFSR